MAVYKTLFFLVLCPDQKMMLIQSMLGICWSFVFTQEHNHLCVNRSRNVCLSPHVQPIPRTLTGASTVQYQHSEALFFFPFVNMLINYMWYYLFIFAFKYRPNEGNNIFLNLVSCCALFIFRSKGKWLASSEGGSTSLGMVICKGRLRVLFF